MEVKKKTVLMSIEMLQSVSLINGSGASVVKTRVEDPATSGQIKFSSVETICLSLLPRLMVDDCSNQPRLL